MTNNPSTTAGGRVSLAEAEMITIERADIKLMAKITGKR